MLAYDAAHVLALLLLQRGVTPMLECTYSRRQQRASLLRVFADVALTPLWIVELSVSADEAVARFRRRQQPTDLTEELVRERVETFPYSHHALRLDSSAAAPDDLAKDITAWLASQPESMQREGWVEVGKGWD